MGGWFAIAAMKKALTLLSLALVAACSPSSSDDNRDAAGATPPTPDATPVVAERGAEAPTMNGTNNGVPPLTAAGFGPYLVGQKVPMNGPTPPQEMERIVEDCRLFTDDNLPGVWIMADGDNVVMRVSVSEPSTLETAAGIGIGASEAEVRAAYPAVRETPHEYVEAPGKNLFTASPDLPGLRFEIGGDGTVTQIHGGRPPFLGYIEGCA